MRAEVERDLLLLRPRSPTGLNELMRRRVFLSLSLSREREPSDEWESMDIDRLARFPSALSRAPAPCCFLRLGGDLEGERLVEIVDTESTEDEESERERLRASSFFLRISSATPFLRRSSLGTSVVSLGLSFGFKSCCVLEGREV